MDISLNQQLLRENTVWLRQRYEKIDQYRQITKRILKAIDKAAQDYKQFGLICEQQQDNALHLIWQKHTYRIRGVVTLIPTPFTASPAMNALIGVIEVVDGEAPENGIMATKFDDLGNIKGCVPEEVGQIYINSLLLVLSEQTIDIPLP